MKKILISIIIINSLIFSTEIKEISIKEIASYYNEEIELIEKLAELSVTNNALRTEKEVFSRLKL